MDILTWAASNKLILSVSNETLMFAAVILIPAAAALYRALVEIDRIKTVFGCGVIAAAVPVVVVMDIIHGRLV